MKDIDFDELDRAVNSLMGSAPKDQSPATPVQVNRSFMSTDSEGETVLALGGADPASMRSDTPSQGPAMTETSEPAAQSSPQPAQSRGKFMDMVRPSGREVRRPFPSSAVSRHAITLQPASASRISSATWQKSDEPDMPTEQPEQPEEVVTMPDFMGTEDTAAAVTVSEPTIAPAQSVETADEVQTDVIEEPAPLTSPFIADAKVEKRPLGRPADMAPIVDLENELSQTMPLDSEPLDVPEPIISYDRDAQLPEQPLPAELNDELLHIETRTEGFETEAPAIQKPEIHPETVKSVEAPVATPVTTLPNPPVSIPQQYKVETTTDEMQHVGAIYDAQPLAHPAKGKPGWLLVLIIIAILVLGAAGGAAVYYLGLL